MRNKINAIHQIEITTRCNLKCPWCVHPIMDRPKQDMIETEYLKALWWAGKFAKTGTQKELNLAGIGESTLHPDFVRWCGLARKAVGEDVFINFASNGILLTDEMARELSKYNIKVAISLHKPEQATHALEIAKKYNMLCGVSNTPSMAAINWAGQVNWYQTVQAGRKCPWISGGQVVVFSDGNIGTCCIDGSGSGIIGTVNEDISKLTVQPYILCETCDQVI